MVKYVILIWGSEIAQNRFCKSAEVEGDDIPHEKLPNLSLQTDYVLNNEAR